MSLHISITRSFLFLSSIPLYGYIEICLSIHLYRRRCCCFRFGAMVTNTAAMHTWGKGSHICVGAYASISPVSILRGVFQSGGLLNRCPTDWVASAAQTDGRTVCGAEASRGQPGQASSKGRRGGSFSASCGFCHVFAFLGLWMDHCTLCFCRHWSSPVCVLLCLNVPLVVRTPVVLDSGPALIQSDLNLTGLHLQRLPSQMRSHLQVVDGWEFRGTLLNPV